MNVLARELIVVSDRLHPMFDKTEISVMKMAAAHIEELQEALQTFVEEYTEMVNSGDCGFWDPEKEDKVIAARVALSKASKSNPNTPERNDK